MGFTMVGFQTIGEVIKFNVFTCPTGVFIHHTWVFISNEWSPDVGENRLSTPQTLTEDIRPTGVFICPFMGVYLFLCPI